MGKNTLVVMGCSMTEGQGCWGDFNKHITKVDDMLKLRKKYRNRFYEFGWPNIVAKELGFDKVINLGKIGSSTSGQLKFFKEQNFGNDNVYIIWMLTEPIRFSFYKKGKIKNIHPAKGTPIGNSYIDFVDDITLDSCLEQLFYIKCMRDISKLNNYNLLITHWNSASKHTQLLDDVTDNYLHKVPTTILPPNRKFISNVCGHPNELGYDWMAKTILKEIKNNNKNFIISDKKDKLEYIAPEHKSHTINKELL